MNLQELKNEVFNAFSKMEDVSIPDNFKKYYDAQLNTTLTPFIDKLTASDVEELVFSEISSELTQKLKRLNDEYETLEKVLTDMYDRLDEFLIKNYEG